MPTSRCPNKGVDRAGNGKTFIGCGYWLANFSNRNYLCCFSYILTSYIAHIQIKDMKIISMEWKSHIFFMTRFCPGFICFSIMPKYPGKLNLWNIRFQDNFFFKSSLDKWHIYRCLEVALITPKGFKKPFSTLEPIKPRHNIKWHQRMSPGSTHFLKYFSMSTFASSQTRSIKVAPAASSYIEGVEGGKGSLMSII